MPTSIKEEIYQSIEQLIKNNDIVLFMKGTKSDPMCGFSSIVVQILERLDIKFFDINILENENLRQGIKEYSNWPTIPQLYIKGEFIGGSDIVKHMFESGDLEYFLKQKGIM